MNKPINVGDLVVVVLPLQCCDSKLHIGRIYQVSGFFVNGYQCRQYGASVDNVLVALVDGAFEGYAVSILKRIPPLSEVEGERTEENIREPA